MDASEDRSAPAAGRAALFEPGELGAWWREGARSAALQPPRWAGLQARPQVAAVLLVALWLANFTIQRLLIAGPANLYLPALQSGWQWTVLTIGLCWWLVPARPAPDGPGAAELFAMVLAQGFALSLAIGLPFVAAMHLAPAALQSAGPVAAWLLWGVPVAWLVLAQCLLAWRAGTVPAPRRAAGVGLMALAVGLAQWTQAPRYWYPDMPAASEREAEPLRPTQAMLEGQAQALAATLDAVAPSRAGAIDFYAITYAPYAGEAVFLRESRLVAGLMAERFGAAGRTVQLVNHRDTFAELPWATPTNLVRAIERVARRMDRDKDVLFIHLTSHGARSGQLAAEFWPLAVDTLTPQALKAALDAAGVRHRVISVSACYSGSWIEPLAGDGTLVMTAADADHTSYGCGSRSPLTFFGRAMYAEQLRETWSFEAAHAKAREVIDQREKEAGKTDGYSNPQIRVGAAIREHLARFVAQREAARGGP